MSETPGLDFLVDKSDFSQTRFDEMPVPELADGQVLFRVDRFALTANNISYALVGDALGYWRFFPAPEGWGRIPAMGFGDVIRSTHTGVTEGTRCFGFYPMSRYLVIQPGSVSPTQIVDAAPHREGLAPAYAQYGPTTGDALYQPEHEDALMLLRGLFLTGFLAEDLLADNDHFGAATVVISSASSKTAIALAHQASQRGAVRVVGLTSSGNRDFVRKLGCYDQVLGYDELDALDEGRAVYVDHSGDGELLRRVHAHYGDRLGHSMGIGATHWDAARPEQELAGPRQEFFFAPGQIQKRAADWGPAGLQERLGSAWSVFQRFSEGWLQVQRSAGRDALERAYRDTLSGKTRPEQGLVLSLSE